MEKKRPEDWVLEHSNINEKDKEEPAKETKSMVSQEEGHDQMYQMMQIGQERRGLKLYIDCGNIKVTDTLLKTCFKN